MQIDEFIHVIEGPPVTDGYARQRASSELKRNGGHADFSSVHETNLKNVTATGQRLDGLMQVVAAHQFQNMVHAVATG
ncbi:hypothetical protein D3C72_2145920 [compost metagenome]